MSIHTPEFTEKLKDELQALKVYQDLSAGQLAGEAASAVWEGTIDSTNPIGLYSILAAFEATFIRTDGVNKPPLVDFAFLISPQIPDKREYLVGNVIATGSNSVTYRICIENLMWWPYETSTGTIKVNVSAYSTVPGNLSIERVYS